MQKTCSTDEAGASCIQGTVVVDARIPAWCPQPDIASRNLAVEVTHDVPDAVAIPSSPSLRPSQSASQIGLLVVKTVHPDEASRYFPVLNPINDPVKYTSSLGRAPEPIEDGTDTGRPFLGDPAKTLDLESPLPSIRFMVPTRNRAFAQHFLPVHHSQPPATYFHAPDAVFPEPEDSRYPEEHYDCAPVSFFGATTEHDQNDIGHEYTASGLGHYGEPQHGQSSAGWDPYTIYPEFGTLADASGEEGDEYTDQYDMYDNGTDDEELNNDLMFQQDFTELDWTGDGNLIELVDEWHVDAHPQFDQYGCYETASFIFGSGDTALTADVEGEVENSTNSMHCADWVDSFDDGEELSVWDDAEAFMETARNDQGTIESSYSVRYNSRGVVSDCGDAGAYHPRFNEGRALLLGLPLPEPSDRASSPRPHLSHAEMNVVKDMGGHWLPQKL
ncbi:hypothetical protein B0H15DRAFT_828992 [Mycena belliarum]|uniref:Uncharacterized protein n=1 Tax=Mycena belliarum TaxID=1033014 RepID=A0AAD6XV91_9AGAR|nr:hypothetical protein B0H15DRAFT_828992 [Mycena belliae]